MGTFLISEPDRGGCRYRSARSEIRNVPILLAAVALLAGGCGAPSGTAPEVGVSSPPARAIDVVGAAIRIDRSTDESSAQPLRVLIEEKFDSTQPADWRIAVLRGSDPPPGLVTTEIATGSTNRYLTVGRVDGPPQIHPQVHRTVTVQPDTLYHLSAVLRAEQLEPMGRESVGASVEIFEWSEPGSGKPLAYHGHLPRERGTSRDWRRLDYTFRTASETRHVSVALVLSPGPASGRACFDDVSLVEVSETAALRHGRSYTSPQGDEPVDSVHEVTLGGDTRPAFLTPVGTAWSWPVDASQGLVLSLGFAAIGDTSAEVCFSVRWDDESLLDDCRPAGKASVERWQDLMLEPGAGQTRGTLLFETRWASGKPSASGLAVWGNPRISPVKPDRDERRPDVVLLIFDTLRVDHIGAEGYTVRPTTPNLDALAGQSVRYARAFAPSGWTTTTLGSLMTSRYPSSHGAGLRIPREIEVSDLVSPPGRQSLGHSGLAAAERTLAQQLAGDGYETVGFHRNLLFGAELGFARGFDRYELYPGEELRGGVEGAELALHWLRERRSAGIEQPYFLVFHLMDPHLPFRMRREYYDEFGPPLLPPGRDLDPTQPFVAFHRWPQQGQVDPADLQKILAMYDSEIAYADKAAGMLLDELVTDDNTIVVALSDHGEGFGAHGRFEHGNSMYDELLRVPLYVRLPGRRSAGTVVDEPVSLLDVAPTILELTGLSVPREMQGRPLPGLAGSPAGGAETRELYAEGAFLGPDQTALMVGGYKYILTHPQGYLGFQDGTPRQRRSAERRPAVEQLYRSVDDSAETRDLWSAEPGVGMRMQATVRQYLRRSSRGLHLRCGGAKSEDPITLTLTATATLGEIKPMTLEPEDQVRVSPSRRKIELELEASDGDEDWLVLRFLDSAAELRLERPANTACPAEVIVAGATAPPEIAIELGDPSLSGQPAESGVFDGCRCEIWEVPGPRQIGTGIDATLDEASLERLRALGYVR